jgi:hypothetical protein
MAADQCDAQPVETPPPPTLTRYRVSRGTGPEETDPFPAAFPRKRLVRQLSEPGPWPPVRPRDLAAPSPSPGTEQRRRGADATRDRERPACDRVQTSANHAARERSLRGRASLEALAAVGVGERPRLRSHRLDNPPDNREDDTQRVEHETPSRPAHPLLSLGRRAVRIVDQSDGTPLPGSAASSRQSNGRDRAGQELRRSGCSTRNRPPPRLRAVLR